MLKKALIAWFCWLLPAGLPAAQIPPRPETDAGPAMLHDTARLLTAADRDQVRRNQQSAWTQSKLPIVVVTIHSMSDYGHSGSIESLARDWFNAWRIGAPRKPSASSAAAPVAANKESRGVLLLVSLRDRRARVELGTAWGRSRDAFCQQVMDQDVIPTFKRKDYSSGIVAGVTALSTLPDPQPTTTSGNTGNLRELLIVGALLLVCVLVFGGLGLFACNMPKAGEKIKGAGLAGIYMIICGMGAFLCGGVGAAIASCDNWWDRALLIGMLAVIMVIGAVRIALGLGTGSGGSYQSGSGSSTSGGGGYSGGYSGGGGASGSW